MIVVLSLFPSTPFVLPFFCLACVCVVHYIFRVVPFLQLALYVGASVVYGMCPALVVLAVIL